MSLWNYWLDKEIFKSVTGNNDPDAYWRFEDILWIFIGFCAATVAAIVGVGYVVYRIWTEIEREITYQHKYGANWQAEYERYHGSLAHTHLRLFIVFFCLFALLAVLLWFSWQFFKGHRRRKLERRRHHHAAPVRPTAP